MSPSPDKKRKRKNKNAKGALHTPSVSGVRRAAKAIARVSDLYGDGETGRLMADEHARNPKIQAVIKRRHLAVVGRVDDNGVYHSGEHSWQVPYGVRLCIKLPLAWVQTVNQYPWYVTWRQHGKRYRKLFNTPLAAIHFIATKAQYVDKGACIVSRQVGYDIPAPLRGKLPQPWRWCPYCMTARRFRRRVPQETFVTLRKEWSDSKGRYEWLERRLAVLECPRCRMTNKDPRMRRSNQPWTIRRFKRGVTRAKRSTQ